LSVKLHLTDYLKGKSKLKIPVSGWALGAGKEILTIGLGTVSLVVVTIYFLVALFALLLNAWREHQDAGRSFLAVAPPGGSLAHGGPNRLVSAGLWLRQGGVACRLDAGGLSSTPPPWAAPASR
jgi:hypothetical protein